MASVIGVNLLKCHHGEARSFLTSYNNATSIADIFLQIHPSRSSGKTAKVKVTGSSAVGGTDIEIDPELIVADLISFNIKFLTFLCICNNDSKEREEASAFVKDVTKKAANAFEVLMCKGRSVPEKKTSSSGLKDGLSKKDGMYNDLVDIVKQRTLDWPTSQAPIEGKYCLQVMVNALWYVTNHHETIEQASRSKLVPHSLPPPFDSTMFKNKNDLKKKKVKTHSLTTTELHSHSQALYSLLLKPVMKSSLEWCKFHDEIQGLADCLTSYANYLAAKLETVQANQKLDHPVRTVGEHATVELRYKSMFVKQRYVCLEKEVSSMKEGEHVFFDESKHLDEPFQNNMQRHRYLHELQLSRPVDIFRFCPGGSILTTVCIVVVAAERTEPQMLTQAARFVMQHKDQFQEYHTRAQKKAFQNKLSNVAKVLPSVSDFIYKELTLDASKAKNPDMEERLRLIFLGETGILADLRQMNSGRPSGVYDTFFEQLGDVVENVTAADERRHGNAHLASWISLEDMISQTKDKCPPDTPIPSKSLVRLQFAPRNPFAKTAWNFTSRINVQYKIQRRQMRLSHPDEHYCNAILKYFKTFAVEMREKVNITVLCCDDKAKVPIGEPGFAVSSGVRGKRSIAPTSSTLVAADHDMTKSSITPTVILETLIPKDPEKSFVRGKVHVSVNDSVFQTSNPFRHAATVAKILEEKNDLNVVMMYTDGGTDHRNTLVSVQASAICLFRQFNLEMMILARCAPGHSWRNPAERIMSILNIGLQNCALEREKCSEQVEQTLKKYGSMKEIRERASPEVRQSYTEAVEPAQRTIMQRFAKLKLKDEPIEVLDPARDEEIDLMKRHLRELFPSLKLDKLVKSETNKVAEFKQWMATHCRERQYIFQIRKCADARCCLPKQTTCPEAVDLHWLPDPILNEDGEHYRSYENSIGKETSEADRPSLKPLVASTRTKTKRPHSPDTREVNVTTPDKLHKPAVSDQPRVNIPEPLDVDTEQVGTSASDDPVNDPAVDLQVVPSEEPDDSVGQAIPANEGLKKPAEGSLKKPTVGQQELVVSMTAQTARGVVKCCECDKPRMYYSRTKLTFAQSTLIAKCISEYIFYVWSTHCRP